MVVSSNTNFGTLVVSNGVVIMGTPGNILISYDTGGQPINMRIGGSEAGVILGQQDFLSDAPFFSIQTIRFFLWVIGVIPPNDSAQPLNYGGGIDELQRCLKFVVHFSHGGVKIQCSKVSPVTHLLSD
ncbi:hypothetical protein HAX54_020084 [Datura stramonium]|uniref:Uncharacterized protein n=1 Tax=Datura stramonium TaxID=4076 RepID=A0ABS8S279_DATST|nr:hypothetical protein [Datura stramonium]